MPGRLTSTSAEITLRRLVAEDLADVRAITWTTWVATYSPFIPLKDMRAYFDEHYDPGLMREQFESGHTRGFIAHVDRVAAGSERTHFDAGEGRFYVSSLYVLPAYQGKGVGMKLFRAAVTEALRYGVDSVWLGVMKQNVRAIDWYKKLGFSFVQEEPFTMGQTTVMHLIGSMKIPPEGTRDE